MIRKSISAVAWLIGLGLVFIGLRFLIAPEKAEISYGIQYAEDGDYSFHYIKGVRDLLSGLLICAFVWAKQRKALAIALLLGTMVPSVDLLIVLSHGYTTIAPAIPHICALVLCFGLGVMLLINKTRKPIKQHKTVEVVRSAATGEESVIEMTILPDEKTPLHYHHLFSETFEILSGNLIVGKGKNMLQLTCGDRVVIERNERHYFHNKSNKDCKIKVTIRPGNTNFEHSLLIAEGLANDNLASSTGIPKKLVDLALFIFLNNANMIGFQKLAQPFFSYLAKNAIKNGRLQELLRTYGKG